MHLNGQEFSYDLSINVTGRACNVSLKAYKIEDGAKVYYPDNDVCILSPDVTANEGTLKTASEGINQIIQQYITDNNL